MSLFGEKERERERERERGRERGTQRDRDYRGSRKTGFTDDIEDTTRPEHTVFSCIRIKGSVAITKTYLYNFDPLGFTGVYIIFLSSAQNIDYGYSLEPPRRGGSNEYPQFIF